MLQENGPSEEEVAKIKKVEQRKWESALQENLFWHELTVNILQHRVYFKVGQVDLPRHAWRSSLMPSAGQTGSVTMAVKTKQPALPLVAVRPDEQNHSAASCCSFLLPADQMKIWSCVDPVAGCMLHAHMAGMRTSNAALDADSICPKH